MSIHFSGKWQLQYWFPSDEFEGEDSTVYDGNLMQKGNELVFESEPREAGDYIFARLRLDNHLATGTWFEQSSPHGFYKGMAYSGAGQLLFDKRAMQFSGMWAGAGLDRQADKPKIYTGRWEIRQVR
jgi:hypothetical protein